MIDLHAHTTASDGTDTPAELVARAASSGVRVLAITDHDTTAGWGEALEARPAELAVIRGTEFSCVYVGPDGARINLHLLGYLFDPEHEGLKAERSQQRNSRRDRGQAMVELLVADGYPISWAQVAGIAGASPVGRPHVAQALVQSRVVGTVEEAFAGLLAHTSKYHVGKQNLDVLTAIGLVREAGGVCVFAHPLAHARGPVVDDDAIRAMAKAGLNGIEVRHPDHDAAARRHAGELAEELNLIVTGSSDYHGTNRSQQLGACTTEPAALDALLALPTALEPVGPIP